MLGCFMKAARCSEGRRVTFDLVTNFARELHNTAGLFTLPQPSSSQPRAREAKVGEDGEEDEQTVKYDL